MDLPTEVRFRIMEELILFEDPLEIHFYAPFGMHTRRIKHVKKTCAIPYHSLP